MTEKLHTMSNPDSQSKDTFHIIIRGRDSKGKYFQYGSLDAVYYEIVENDELTYISEDLGIVNE